jgi:hAT family C-terminal dimerisation region
MWRNSAITQTRHTWNHTWNLASSAELTQLAIALLSITASEAAVERTFSRQGLVHSKLRNRLSDRSVQSQMFFSFNTRALEHPDRDMSASWEELPDEEVKRGTTLLSQQEADHEEESEEESEEKGSEEEGSEEEEDEEDEEKRRRDEKKYESEGEEEEKKSGKEEREEKEEKNEELSMEQRLAAFVKLWRDKTTSLTATDGQSTERWRCSQLSLLQG